MFISVYVRVPQESSLNTPGLIQALQVISRSKSVEMVAKEMPADCTLYHLENNIDIGIILKVCCLYCRMTDIRGVRFWLEKNKHV